MTMKIFSLLLCVSSIYPVFSVKVPDFIHVCSRNEPALDDCIIRSVNYLKPYLKEGQVEYNIPSLEPLLLKKIVAGEGTGINIITKDVYAYGASNFYVRKLKADLNLLRFAVDIDLPHLYINGLYEIEGRVLLLPISGSGPMLGNFTEVTAAVKFQCELIKDINGEDHIQATEFKIKISIGKGTLQLENLFNGDRALGEVVNNAINNNFDVFIHELQPIIEKALSEAFHKIANNILTPFTFDQLFPN